MRFLARKASFCEGCPKSEAFERINEAAKSKNKVVRNAGKLGKSLLNLATSKGALCINAPGKAEEPFCCKQALISLADDTLKRAEHSAIKNKPDN